MIKAKRFDSVSYQMYAGEALVGVAVAYGGRKETWRLHDGAGRLVPEYGPYESPRALAKAMTERAKA